MTKLDPIKQFEHEKKQLINKLGRNKRLKKISESFIKESAKVKYTYNFNWLGRPIIQLPQDIVAVQELIWLINPDLIIETGIAHGGSIVLSASILELIGGDGLVLGIDIDIRKHNKKLIENHKMFKRIKMLEGSSIDLLVFDEVKKIAKSKKIVMVLLDSSHTHDHVSKELELYSQLVTKNSYIVVFDTALEIMPKVVFKNRPWNWGNNPKTAVIEFLKSNKDFIIDKNISNKLMITANEFGYLKRIQ